MFMNKFLLIIATVLVVSCASETEQKSLDKIAEIYGATTSYSKGFSSSAGTETIRSFTARISESDLIDSLNPNVTSSNIALLVYEGFEENEKGKYKQINVEMVNKKGDTVDYSYPVSVLSKLSAKSKIFHLFSESLVNNNAGAIDEIRNEKTINEPVGKRVITAMTGYKQKYGTLISYEPFGISEVSDEKGAAYQFQSNLVFSSGKKLPYLVVVDSSPGSNKLDGFKFFE
jgi:hypothetical protein